MDGGRSPQRIRAEVADEVAELGHVGLATVLVGDDPASDVYIDAKHKAAHRGGHRRARRPAAGRHERGGRPRARRRAQRRRRGRRDPRAAAAAARTWTRRASRTPSRRTRTSTASIRSTPGNLYLGTPLHVPGDAGGLHGAPARVRRRPTRQRGGRDRPQRDRRAARRRCCSSRRTRRSRSATRAPPTSPRRSGGPTSSSPRSACRAIVTPEMVKPGAAVLDVGLTRTDEGIRGDVDPRRRRGRGLPDADAGRDRPDDDRAAPRGARSRPRAIGAGSLRIPTL